MTTVTKSRTEPRPARRLTNEQKRQERASKKRRKAQRRQGAGVNKKAAR